MIFSKSIATLCLLAVTQFTWAQITSGKITYERKTNLLKKIRDDRAKRWINESNKNKIDVFNLYFNDSLSVFVPAEASGGQDMMSWMTNKNTVIQNLNAGTRTSILSIWGEEATVQDSVVKRTWKITDNRRKIGKYQCTKAIFQMNDSVRIYAWFSEDIIPAVGPETFRGLPGAILGLATEDGGVVYFAKQVELITPEFDKITPKVSKNKVYSEKQLRDKLQADFGDKPWGKGLVDELFAW